MDDGGKALLDLAVSATEARLRAALRLTWDVARKPDAPSVHHLRISCRRLRTAIALFCDVAPIPPMSNVDEAARRMAKAVANLRATDVAVDLLDRIASRSTDPDFTDICHAVARALARRRRSQSNQQRGRIRKRAKALEKAIVARIPLLREGASLPAGSANDTSADDSLGTKIGALRATARRRIQKALGERHTEGEERNLDARLHRVRIAIKHWRYAEEVVGHAVPETARGGARLKKLQELGGKTRDLADLARLVRREVRNVGKKGHGAALLLAAIERRHRTATRRFVQALGREIAEVASASLDTPLASKGNSD
jgi:CHAD domain-containing protein